jgi:hypothetical protein
MPRKLTTETHVTRRFHRELTSSNSCLSFREGGETYKLNFACDRNLCMSEKGKKGIVKRGGWEIAKKLLKAIPIIGPVFTVGFAGHDIKKKGLFPGAVHVGLDATPVVGTAKNVVEIFTGDFIPDKASAPQTAPRTPEPVQPTSNAKQNQ